MPLHLEDDVPDGVREILTEYKHVWRPMASDLSEDTQPGDVLPDEIKTMYDRADGGLCMTCGRPVGEYATAVVNDKGWALLFCSQACWQDMIITNYLSDQYGQTYESIKERGDMRE